MKRSESKSYTLREIVERFGGEVIGDSGTAVGQVATLEKGQPGTIAFLANERYLPQARTTRAGAVILAASMRDATDLPRIACDNPYAYFARVSDLLNPPRQPVPGIHETAVTDATARIAEDAEIGPLSAVGRNARIGPGCAVGPGCMIGDNVVLGKGVLLHANVTIYHDCVIGERVILHSGVIIGADGFGLAMGEGEWIKIPQIGRVVIGDNVEVGANTTIDRGAIDDTVIEEGVKLDNQIQIAHNVRVGAHTAIAACAGIAGSAKVGRHCRIGGASGIAGHIVIADHVEISAHTLITKSIEKPGTYTGAYPFDANREWRRNAAQLRRLDELAARVRTLERKLAALERSKS
ncbi:MAG: UDP-3-O-(3-hydroxymyristoyl)glucosamine N-acyltransferase [Betaproteobacteria bacterium]|nr:UDP-3-O-(3-hydroxymyristoyl)glucosamine N-acyltransferase [Betaproteobacteria bacterium]